MSLLAKMPHKVTVKRRDRKAGTMPGSVTRPVTTAKKVACWVQPASASEVMAFEKRGIVVTNKIYFPTDPGLDEKQELLYGTRELTVRSAASPDASAGLGVLYRVMAQDSDSSRT